MGKKSIVILHGWGLSGETFQPLSRVLAKKGYTVFSPDLPGFGKSPAPVSPVDLSYYVQFLYNFLKKNRIRDPIIIAHSFGGRIVLKYLFFYPTSVCGVVLTGVPGYTPVPRGRRAVCVALAKVGKFIFAVPPLSLFRDHIRTWYYYVAGAREYYRARGTMRETFKHIVQENLESYMKHVRVPTILAWGENDRITPLWIARKMAKTIPHARLVVIANSDHGVSYKNPEDFMRSIASYI
jgi:pimeloyl-ACP methyl ester carboxylesterase